MQTIPVSNVAGARPVNNLAVILSRSLAAQVLDMQDRARAACQQVSIALELPALKQRLKDDLHSVCSLQLTVTSTHFAIKGQSTQAEGLEVETPAIEICVLNSYLKEQAIA